MIDFEIISSGSKGNAVIFNNSVLIDCGVPMNALEKHVKKLNLVLLTHEHSDHLKKTTVKALANERPTLRFGCGAWLVPILVDIGVSKKNIDVYELGKIYNYGAVKVSPIKLYHDVENCGYRLFFGEFKVMYATDTAHLDGITAKDYDLYMIEANYTQTEIEERIRTKIKLGQYVHEYRTKQTHLSREQANDFIYANIGKKGQYIYMHRHKEAET